MGAGRRRCRSENAVTSTFLRFECVRNFLCFKNDAKHVHGVLFIKANACGQPNFATFLICILFHCAKPDMMPA
jgi:hypothetical protein